MASSDDISGLWQQQPPSNPAVQPFRQATVLTFDPTTGANTVNLAGAILTNLPLLNIGDTVNLKAGDTVILMKMNNTMAILGRVIQTGGTGILTSVAVDFQSANNFASNFAISTSFVTKVSTTITVPPWANKALVTAHVYLNVSTATSVSFQAQTVIGGSTAGIPATMNGVTPPNTVPAPGATIGFVANGQVLAFAATPGAYTIEGQANASVAVPANAFTAIGIMATAIYTKV